MASVSFEETLTIAAATKISNSIETGVTNKNTRYILLIAPAAINGRAVVEVSIDNTSFKRLRVDDKEVRVRKNTAVSLYPLTYRYIRLASNRNQNVDRVFTAMGVSV